jgi:phosphoribosylformylglycinamidine synthase
MAFTGGLGLDLDIGKVPVNNEFRDDFVLFSESNGRLLVEVPPEKTNEFEKIMRYSPKAVIGAIKKDPNLTVMKDDKLIFENSLNSLIQAWKMPLEGRR